MLEEMRQLIREKNICVLATIAGDKPHCSLMSYAADEACTEVFLATHRRTRKFQNLTANPVVSLLIDTREAVPRTRARALTIEGICRVIEEGVGKEMAHGRLLANNPHLEEFLAQPETAVLSVRITSLLLLKGISDAHHVKLG